MMPDIPPPPLYKDRKTGLLVFGIFELLLGLFFVLKLALGAVALLLIVPRFGGVLPVFNWLITGPLAIAGYAAFAVFLVYSAYGLYRLRLKIYWMYVTVAVVAASSSGVGLISGTYLRLYRRLDLPETQVNQLEQLSLLHSPSLPWYCVFISLVYLGYLLWIRKYFVATKSP